MHSYCNCAEPRWQSPPSIPPYLPASTKSSRTLRVLLVWNLCFPFQIGRSTDFRVGDGAVSTVPRQQRLRTDATWTQQTRLRRYRVGALETYFHPRIFLTGPRGDGKIFAFYSGCLGFKPRSEDWLSWLRRCFGPNNIIIQTIIQKFLQVVVHTRQQMRPTFNSTSPLPPPHPHKNACICPFVLPHGTLCGSGAGRPGCITYEAVNEAFLRGRGKVGLRHPHRSTTVFTLAQLGSALQETTRLLADRWVTSSRLERSQKPNGINSVTVIIIFNWREDHLFQTITLENEAITLSK